MDTDWTHHHCVVINSEGASLLSQRVANDEPELLRLITDVRAHGAEVTWAVDMIGSGAALLTALLVRQQQCLLYLPARILRSSADGFRGEAKTNARDAAIIAEARMRRDLQTIHADDDTTAALQILTGRRTDLVTERTRALNRLNSALPALDKSLNLRNRGPLILLAGYQTPAALRRTGRVRLESWLREHHVSRAARLADTAHRAAERQRTPLPGEAITAQIVRLLAEEALALTERIADTDHVIDRCFHAHPHAEVITSMPGIGPLLGAEFLAAIGGDLTRFDTPDRLASYDGLAPVPRDSGILTNSMRRPRRYHRGLQRVFYQSALISIQYCPDSKALYDRKCSEGKTHTQAVLVLARRRVNVLWALLRDQRPYEPHSTPRRHRPASRHQRGKINQTGISLPHPADAARKTPPPRRVKPGREAKCAGQNITPVETESGGMASQRQLRGLAAWRKACG